MGAMALWTNTAEEIEAADAGEREPRTSPEVDWAWARIFSDFEQRPAVFTDVRQPDNPIQYATPAFCALTGYSLAELAGRNCRLLQGPDTDPEAVAAIRAALSENLPITVDILNYRKDGTPFWNRVRIRPVIGPGGIVRRFIGVQNEIDAGEVRPGAYLSFAA
jgi:PAS domain S-box-containing protein